MGSTKARARREACSIRTLPLATAPTMCRDAKTPDSAMVAVRFFDKLKKKITVVFDKKLKLSKRSY